MFSPLLHVNTAPVNVKQTEANENKY